MTVPGLPVQKVGRELVGHDGRVADRGKAAGRQPQAGKRTAGSAQFSPLLDRHDARSNELLIEVQPIAFLVETVVPMARHPTRLYLKPVSVIVQRSSVKVPFLQARRSASPAAGNEAAVECVASLTDSAHGLRGRLSKRHGGEAGAVALAEAV